MTSDTRCSSLSSVASLVVEMTSSGPALETEPRGPRIDSDSLESKRTDLVEFSFVDLVDRFSSEVEFDDRVDIVVNDFC